MQIYRQQMEMDVLCVNEKMLKRDYFRNWSYQYRNMDRMGAPEPYAYDSQEGRPDLGIWIHWNLPAKLRREGELVPNRWLVMAVNEEDVQDVAQWIVESDCPASEEQKKQIPEGVFGGGSSYLVTPEIRECWKRSGDSLREKGEIMVSGQAAVCRMGAAFGVQEWQERSAAPLFLTAVSAANPAFSQFIPHCRNIFSAGFLPSRAKAVYRIGVFGWYSVPPQGQENTVYMGMVSHVAWDRNGEIPASDPLNRIVDSGLLNVAAGNSAYEAFCAVLENTASPGQERFVEWLKAICLDHPETEKELDGQERLWEYGHREGFAGQGRNLRYQIVPEKTEDGAEQEEAVLTETEAKALEELNRAQQALEEEQQILRGMQRKLYGLWWKRKRFSMYPSQDGITDQSFAPCFDTEEKNSLLSRTVEQWRKVEQCARTLPRPVCGEGKKLKAIPGEPFYRAGNPVLALLGVKPPAALKHEDRYPMEEWSSEGQPERKNLPAAVDLCIQEFFRSAGEDGEKSSVGRTDETYQMAWEPMYMEWRLSYRPIPYEKNWQFNGKEYVLTEHAVNSEREDTEEYSGISLLSGHVQWTLADKMDKFLTTVKQESGEEAETLTQFVKNLETMDMLMVELSGFHENLLQLDNRAFVIPQGETVSCHGQEYSMAGLMGFGGTDEIPAVEHAPLMTSDVSNGFYGMRGGQILLQDVALYDKFGRVLHIISSEDRSGLLFDENFEVFPYATMKPEYNLYSGEAAYPLELRPRLMQPARLEVRQKQMEGVFLVNYLNHSLEFFAPTGEPLGVLACGREDEMQWRMTPGCRGFGGIDEVVSAYPALGQLIVGLSQENGGSGRFWEFLDLIEDTLWDNKGISRCGEKSGMALTCSRPLALVTVEASCVLEDAPYRPQDRKYTFAGGEDYTEKLRLPICPGNLADAGDGLIGYFTAGMPDRMYMVGQAQQETDFFRQITPEEGFLAAAPAVSAQRQELCLLMDAGAPVHFYTGLLPTAAFSVDSREWEKTTAGLEAFYETGPVLSWTEETDRPALKIPMQIHEDTLRFTFGDEEEWELAAMKTGEREPSGETRIYEGYLVEHLL